METAILTKKEQKHETETEERLEGTQNVIKDKQNWNNNELTYNLSFKFGIIRYNLDIT